MYYHFYSLAICEQIVIPCEKIDLSCVSQCLFVGISLSITFSLCSEIYLLNRWLHIKGGMHFY